MQLEIWIRSSGVKLWARNIEKTDEVNKDELIQGEAIAEKGETNNKNQKNPGVPLLKTSLGKHYCLQRWPCFHGPSCQQAQSLAEEQKRWALQLKCYEFYDKRIYRLSGYKKAKVENLTWEIDLDDEQGLYEDRE